ncbi:MAG: hypothetical protein ABSA09_06920 [Desulfobaccales bacterium]|jgi:hypothetical protein
MANLRKWFTGKEVKEKLDISNLDLCELIKDGKLTAHDPDTGEKVLLSLGPSLLLPSSLNGPMIDLTPDGIIFIDLPDTEEVIISAKDLDKCFFSFDDVEPLLGVQSQKQSISGEQSQKLCKPGTRWEDIEITLLSNEMVRIKTPAREERYTYAELGLSDKRKGDAPTLLWGLLKLFAQNNGFISRENPKYDARLPNSAKRLNEHLRKLFGIDESLYTAHYKKERGYRTKIIFSNETFPQQPF